MTRSTRVEQSAPRRSEGTALRPLIVLREQTAAIHAEVEALLGLLDPGLAPSRLADVLARFEAFWRVAEDGVDHWALGRPELADALDWPRRRRAELLAADVRALGGGLLEVAAEPSVVPATDAEVFGWLYVSEGSTLGGAVLSRHLAPLGLDVASFSPYPEGPGPMWRQFAAVVGAWSADDPVRVSAVARAGEQAFTALAAWLAPLRVGAAA